MVVSNSCRLLLLFLLVLDLRQGGHLRDLEGVLNSRPLILLALLLLQLFINLEFSFGGLVNILLISEFFLVASTVIELRVELRILRGCIFQLLLDCHNGRHELVWLSFVHIRPWMCNFRIFAR